MIPETALAEKFENWIAWFNSDHNGVAPTITPADLRAIFSELDAARAKATLAESKLAEAVKALEPFARIGDLLAAYEAHISPRKPRFTGLGAPCLVARQALASILGSEGKAV